MIVITPENYNKVLRGIQSELSRYELENEIGDRFKLRVVPSNEPFAYRFMAFDLDGLEFCNMTVSVDTLNRREKNVGDFQITIRRYVRAFAHYVDELWDLNGDLTIGDRNALDICNRLDKLEKKAKLDYKAADPGYGQAKKKGYHQGLKRAHSEVMRWAMDLMPKRRNL